MMLASPRGRQWRNLWRTSRGVGVNRELGFGSMVGAELGSQRAVRWEFGEGALGGREGVEESSLGVVLAGSINIVH